MVVTTTVFCSALDALIEQASQLATNPASEAVRAKLQEAKVLCAKLAA